MTDRVWSPWRTVVGFGLVSLTADLVYEGARSVTGPLLASLGASALLVGIVSGAGEAIALVLRLFFGQLADRTGGYWRLTIVGYGLTAVSVPLLALAPFVGSAGLALACVLILAERTGKAVRSPSKSALLAIAAEGVGRGRGFGVHKALDQIGAFAGPLAVAGAVAITSRIWPALAMLAIPGAVAMALLLVVQRRMPVAPAAEISPSPAAPGGRVTQNLGLDLPHRFFVFAGAAAATTAGLVSYGLIGFHLSTQQVVSTAMVPVLYAVAMAAAAVAALITGWTYDRVGGKVLYGLPILVALSPALTLSSQLPLVLLGLLAWGSAIGLQDSTVKALVADLVPASHRATAYGVFAAIQGGAAVLGGAVAGFLYTRSIPTLVAIVIVTQVVALALIAKSTRGADRSR
ncbi:MFS transporter [Aeromicrobium sp.]|uniref:MFS transporter n=1 Tax=Aeromicrobium sp. TaxID=1871063 RepID=UPI003C375F9A